MRKITILFSACAFLISMQTTEAQLWKKIKKRAENSVEKKAGKEIDEAINKKKNKKSIPEKDKKQPKTTADSTEVIQTETETNISAEIWRNYKFIPGEKVVFYDNLQFEEIGEFPSRWDLLKGGAEIARFNGEKVIIGTAEYSNRIQPLFDTPAYLSDEFTIEFDIYVDNLSRKNYNSWAYYNVYFDSKRASDSGTPDVKIGLRSGKTDGYAAKHAFGLEEVSLGELNAWHHIAMSYHKGKFKLYYDDTRIVNLPKFDMVPEVFTLDFSGHGSRDSEIKVAVKNIRIAHGGGQMYKRILADGKYVTQGILFDVGKDVLQPASYGIITKLSEMLKDNEDWNFEIIGHTDSDGAETNNQILSQKRADAVKNALIQNGIKGERLTTSGKGESAPLNTNSTPEEKANNRRVEFILKK